MTDYAPSGVAQKPSGKAQPHQLHVTRRVPRSVHAKFYADWTKTVGARWIHPDRRKEGQSYFNNIDTFEFLKSRFMKWLLYLLRFDAEQFL